MDPSIIDPMVAALPGLVRRAAIFSRSRRQLIRSIVEHPKEIVPALVELSKQSLGTEGTTVDGALAVIAETSVDRELLWWIYQNTQVESFHFAVANAVLVQKLLALIRIEPQADRALEGWLLRKLGEHLRDTGHVGFAAEASHDSVTLYRSMLSTNLGMNQQLVQALIVHSRNLSERRSHAEAIATGREAVQRSGYIRGPEKMRVRGQARVALGFCLTYAGLHKEAVKNLRLGYNSLRSCKNDTEQDQAILARAARLRASVLRARFYPKARSLAEESFFICRGLVAKDKGSHLESYLESSDVLADIASSRGDFDRSRELSAEGITYLSGLARRNPARFLERYAAELPPMIMRLLLEHEFKDALTYVKAAMVLARKLVHRHREQKHKLNELLAELEFLMAVARLGLGQIKLSLSAAQKAKLYISFVPEHVPNRQGFLEKLDMLFEVLDRALASRL